jgi:hypothetical protein
MKSSLLINGINVDILFAYSIVYLNYLMNKPKAANPILLYIPSNNYSKPPVYIPQVKHEESFEL